MPTAVFVHPHPDDEAIFTGGSMRRVADAGWRVVLVLATGGEEGTMPDWVTVDAADHRRMETAEAAAVLAPTNALPSDAQAGWATNQASGALAASIEEATEALATVLRRCGADAVVGQDPNGIYGHPDHVAVHRVVTGAAAAARVAETGKMLQLEPMPALERRWIHLTLRDDPNVVTQSIGEEPNRRVVLVPRGG